MGHRDNDFNLNELEPDYDSGEREMGAYEADSEDRRICVHFRDLEDMLEIYIRSADAIVGCVAWLTNERILDALAKVENVAIVVQKEDFLRPDRGSKQDWKQVLHKRYSKLRCSWHRYNFPGLIGSLSILDSSSIDPVRCAGNYNRDKFPAFPRMHHKFLVFCRYGKLVETSISHDPKGIEEPYVEYEFIPPKPYAVWTGSFNFTENSTRSLENALYITDPVIASAYYDEWARVEAISERLNWRRDWAEPEWRIGT